jgi:hypothetical protein
VSQDEPAAKQSKLDSSVPQVPERANVEGKIINRDLDSARNDSRALPDDGRQHDIKKQDSENNNPKKDEDVVKGGDSRGGGQEGEGDEDSQEKQTGNSVSEPLR